jgi:hypothetical protein
MLCDSTIPSVSGEKSSLLTSSILDDASMSHVSMLSDFTIPSSSGEASS